jgi:hypothetical protein
VIFCKTSSLGWTPVVGYKLAGFGLELTERLLTLMELYFNNKYLAAQTRLYIFFAGKNRLYMTDLHTLLPLFCASLEHFREKSEQGCPNLAVM